MILRAALDELSAVGADEGDLAGMAPIAERAGVTAAAMYYHFRSKAELLVALLEFVEPRVDQLVDTVADVDDLVQWADALVKQFAEWLREDPSAARFYFITAASVAAPEVHAAYDASQNRLARRLAARIGSLSPTLDDLTCWVRGMSLLALLHEMVALSLQNRSSVSRGFSTVQRVAEGMASRIVGER